MDKRIGGMVAAVVGMALLLVGGLTKRWWVFNDVYGEGGLGLRSAEYCRRECTTMSFEKIGTDDMTAFVMFGKFAFFGSFIVIVILGVAVAMAGGRKAIEGAVSPARLGLLLSGLMSIVAILFVATLPSDFKSIDPSISYSMPLYLLGALLGMFGAWMLSTTTTVVETATIQPSAPLSQGVSPACPQCAAPTIFSVKHSRHFCADCNVYI